MRKVAAIYVLSILAVALAGCTGESPQAPANRDAGLAIATFDPITAPEVQRNFFAVLSGGEEVPANDSQGRGVAKFQLSEDGLSLHYSLTVANIENVTASHIHLAPAGANGGVVVFLFGPAAPAGPLAGKIAMGTITGANLINALAGEPLSVLIDHMRSGNAYVNVHTSQIPGGEIRGQIQ